MLNKPQNHTDSQRLLNTTSVNALYSVLLCSDYTSVHFMAFDYERYFYFSVLFIVVVSSVLCVLASLAVHPDKIRIATGQIAGVDKDGRVKQAVFLFFSRFCV